MPLGRKVGPDSSDIIDIVLDGNPAPLPKKGHSAPKFLAHIYCAQTAGCIKIPIGMEVGVTAQHSMQQQASAKLCGVQWN